MSGRSEDSVCKSFQLHPRRKLCKECKHPREDHPLSEEDIKEIQDILTSLAKDSGAEATQSSSVYAWIPPQCPEERLDDYFNCFLEKEVPKHNSEGLQWRLKSLMNQIPKTDISVSACRFVDPQKSPELEEFIENLRKKSLSFGLVKAWLKGMPMQCPTCLILLEKDELVVVPTLQSSSAFHPACFICSTCRTHLVDLVHCFQVGGKIYCVRHNSETYWKRCHACDELIFDERFSQAEGVFYHTDHLRCFHCDDSLDQNKGYSKHGELYCVTCYDELYGVECQKCGRHISLETRFIRYEGKFWHTSCFTCEKCDEVITEFEHIDGKYYCTKCFNDHIAPRCGSCKQLFNRNDQCVNYKEQQFHIDCFKCCDCEKTIGTGKFLPHGELAYCNECFNRNFGVRCFKCKYAITDENAIKYEKQPYHDKCFTCHRCQARLGGQPFKTVEDDMYCVHCYGETFCRKCHSCSQPILLCDSDDDVLYSYGDLRWHAECFICRVCERFLADTPFAIQDNVLICKGCANRENTSSCENESSKTTERLSKSSKEREHAKSSVSGATSPDSKAREHAKSSVSDATSPDSKARVPGKKSSIKNQKKK